MSSLPIAVLIVNFRVYEDLERALAAIERGSGADDEIVVFDQVSDPRRLEAVAARYPRARFLPSASNVGFAAAVNRAARETVAPCLLLVNPDTLLEPAVVDTLVAWLETHPETGLVGPRVVNDDGTVQASARRFPGPSAAIAGRSTWLSRRFPGNWLTRRNLVARDATGPVTVDWLAGSCLMVRRDLFERLGGFDEAFFLYWEDADLCRRAAALGFSCTYLPTVSVRHAGGRSAAQDPKAAIRAFHASAYRLYWKHGGVIARSAAPLVRAALWIRGELRAWWAGRQARKARHRVS